VKIESTKNDRYRSGFGGAQNDIGPLSGFLICKLLLEKFKVDAALISYITAYTKIPDVSAIQATEFIPRLAPDCLLNLVAITIAVSNHQEEEANKNMKDNDSSPLLVATTQ